MTVEIAYTDPMVIHETMILHGVSYSVYIDALRCGSNCTYGIAPSSQSSLNFYGLSCDVYLVWYLRPVVFPPMLCCQYNKRYTSYFLKTLDLPSGEGV